jgi:hypothetical protein
VSGGEKEGFAFPCHKNNVCYKWAKIVVSPETR